MNPCGVTPFTTLFSGGYGIPEGKERRVPLSLDRWIEHSLKIGDPRFRKHSTFMFYIYNVQMRRKTSLHANITLKNPKSNTELN